MAGVLPNPTCVVVEAVESIYHLFVAPGSGRNDMRLAAA